MNTITPSVPHRSEAFAEDVLDLLTPAPDFAAVGGVPGWLVNALPVAVALLGMAFAVLPPLA